MTSEVSERNAVLNVVDARVEEAILRETPLAPIHIIFSAYQDWRDINLDAVAIEGTIRIVYDAGVWNQTGETYTSEPITNPTWLQVTVCVNQAIAVTGDTHHVFFEGIEALAQVGDATLCKIYMGS